MIHHGNHRWSAAIAFAFLLALPGIAAAAGDHDGGHGHDGGGDHHQQDNHHDDGHDEHGMAEEGHHDEAMHGEGHGKKGEGHGHGHGHGGHSAGFGRPAKAEQADRTVHVTALDTMRFKPESIHVEPGQTVRFVVENAGTLQHSFTLGTPNAQRKHEKKMQGMSIEKMAGHMRNDPTGMVIQPGATDSLTWHFKEGGPVQFACHIPGHYEAGMKGRIRIE